MPTTYAHELFGKMVYRRCGGEIKGLIERNREAYRIGLHGPDILFYRHPFWKNKVNRMGHELHKKEAKIFFERGRILYQGSGDEKVLTYLLGFFCHFMLDSTCHPYISEYMKKRRVRHDEIETDFDRELMEVTGKDPGSFRPAEDIIPGNETLEAISRTLGGISVRDVRRSLEAMRFYTGLPVRRTELGRKLLLTVGGMFGIYPIVKGRMMQRPCNEKCRESTAELKRLFLQAVPEAAGLLEEFYEKRQTGEKLNGRLKRNYK